VPTKNSRHHSLSIKKIMNFNFENIARELAQKIFQEKKKLQAEGRILEFRVPENVKENVSMLHNICGHPAPSIERLYSEHVLDEGGSPKYNTDGTPILRNALSLPLIFEILNESKELEKRIAAGKLDIQKAKKSLADKSLKLDSKTIETIKLLELLDEWDEQKISEAMDLPIELVISIIKN